MVVGNISSGALPTSVSPSAAIFQSEPYGVPCASETYQNLPSGETVTLWGPSMSAGMMPTGTTLTVRSALPSQASWVTMSPSARYAVRLALEDGGGRRHEIGRAHV